MIKNELLQGKQIANNAKKPHVDQTGQAPGTKESSYRFNFLDFKMPQKLVFGTPRLPKYPLKWLGDT